MFIRCESTALSAQADTVLLIRGGIATNPATTQAIAIPDALYASGIAIACVVAGLVAIPPLMSNTVSAWADRAVDSQRMNIRENRPEVTEAQARVADYFRERGVYGPDLQQ